MRIKAILLTLAAFVSLFAGPAHALTTGECLPAAQVRSALADESMQPIIVGNRTGYGYATSLIFFANEDGSHGYLIRGDKPLGQQSETACIDSEFHNVRLNDATRAGIPSWSRLPVDAAKVATTCAGHMGYQDQCIRHDISLRNMESNGLHVMLMTTGTAINPRDHSVRRDQRLLVTLDTQQQGGLINAITSDGASYTLSAYTSVSYTQFGSAMLDGYKR